MATKEIKQKIVLEGEKQYNQALKEAQRNLKTLKSELKAETAELGKNATEQQKAETKTKNLQKQIKEQEKVVATYRKELEEVRKKYGDNADAIASYEQKLNGARATLANMRNDLEGVGNSFQKANAQTAAGVVAAKSYADTLGQIANVGGAISDAIEGIFTGMVDTVREAISAVWEDMVDLASRANAWVDLAGFWNTDVATIQKWSRAVEGAHDSFDDFQSIVTRINMGDQKKITAATGVSGVNYEDKWKYAMAVMDAMSRMDYNQQLEAAGEVFGEKRATKVLDILNDWQTIQENLKLFDVENGGIGMTEEQIQDMATLAEQVDKIKVTWRAFLDSFEAKHFGKLALDLTGGAQVILEDLIKYLDTGSDEDLAKLEQDITDFFDRIVAAIQAAAGKLDEAGKKLQESDNGIVRAIGNALVGISDALQWISDEGNIQKVIAGFEVLAGFWVAGKGLQMASTVAQLAANLAILNGSSALGGAGGLLGGAAGAAGGAGLGGLITTAGYVAVGIMMVAPTVAKLLNPGEKTELEQKVEKVEAQQEKDALGVDKGAREANKAAGVSNQDLLRGLVAGALGTGTPTQEISKKTEEGSGGRYGADEEKSYSIPRAGNRKFDVTEEQRATAEAFWDAWKNGDSVDIAKAYAAFEAAFEEDKSTFEKIKSFINRLYEWMDEAGADHNTQQPDLPAEWWKNPGRQEGYENGITSADLQKFGNLPAQMASSVGSAVASGMRNIRVSMDGRTVGSLVAPYVSQAIARSLIP